MEFDHENVRQAVEEDRLSMLPNELIHKIMSCLDMKFAVQTCVLSPRWKLLWTSMPCLNFYSGQFRTIAKFSKFVTNVLSRRNHQVQVSSVKLAFRGAVSQAFVKKIASYAFSHNVQQLTIVCCPIDHRDFPPCLFSSQSLKHFTLRSCNFSPCVTPETPWDFPALTTLHLSDITLCDNDNRESIDVFSKCVNLQNLTLEKFRVVGVGVIDIITPRLSNLKLIDAERSISVNLIAPQLENLTIDHCSIKYLNAPPGLSSLCYRDRDPIQLPKDGFHSLAKVSICLHYCYVSEFKEEHAWKTINMLQKLHSAKYLTLDWDIVLCLSSFSDLVSHHPSPFSNLICLTISQRNNAYRVKMSTQVRNFFLDNSPNAIMELPEALLIKMEPLTKAMKQKEAREKNKAKLALEIESHTKELQALVEQGKMVVERKEKAKAVFEKLVAEVGDIVNEEKAKVKAIISKEDVIISLLESLAERESAHYSRQVEEAEALRARLLSKFLTSEDIFAFEKLVSHFVSTTPSSPSTA